MMKNYLWFCYLFLLGGFIYSTSFLYSAPRYIEAIDATDSQKLSVVYVSDMSVNGRIVASNGELVPYHVDMEFLFTKDMNTNDLSELYSASPSDNISVKSITIKIRGKTARLEGGEISKICNPPMPRALNIMGLKPDGLVIMIVGPLDSAGYVCQIQANPRGEAIVLIREAFKGKNGGWGSAKVIARAPFK